MHAGAAINFGLLITLNTLALIGAFFFPPGFATFLIYLSLPCLCYHIFNTVGFDSGRYNRVFNLIIGVFLSQICIYSVAYWKAGLISGGQKADINFWDALYFSITTWTTTGYGDFSPPPRLRLIASTESLLGIFSMGIFIGIVSNWISRRTQDRLGIMKHNRKIIKEFEKSKASTKDEDTQKGI